MLQTVETDWHGTTLKLHRNRKTGGVSNVTPKPKIVVNQPIRQNGTVLAIITLHLGVPPFLARKHARGGARNRSDRTTDALTAAQITNLLAATAHAETIGLPLNRLITLHWESAGIDLADLARATYRFTDLLKKALARHKSGTAWIWTHENGDGKGGHCHLLAHVPAGLVRRVTDLQRGWLRSITGKPYRARVIRSDPIGGRLGLELGNPELHAVNLQVALGYICKAASQAVLDANGIDRQHEPGGLIIGKRCGTSQNIAAKARQAPTD
ncbi:MAG: hypothetical protein M3N34_07600 [Pseudomonadota bacterium]|nr:hypothetical protein [Pseudomonadota bacterium]